MMKANSWFATSLFSQEVLPTLSSSNFCEENMQILLITKEMKNGPP